EKVWKRAEELGSSGFSVVIHGKEVHEETRATFSHARTAAPSIVIRDMKEAQRLAEYIKRKLPFDTFFADFPRRCSEGFNPERDLSRIGVVNQTTMLASETLAIAELLKDAMRQFVGEQTLTDHFADTRDTLCYATWDNQEAVKGLVASGGDLALVVGGYKSSNTSHLVEILEEHLPTFYIQGAQDILNADLVRHFMWRTAEVKESVGWLPREQGKLTVLVTAGASCPDAVVDEVIFKVAELCGASERLEALAQSL
ncbi:MAG: 4-hydroxy-3-methylbut-2-enyl diphosphate reductase, partial [Proteobacteria bacterium]|nr:4-hydroxy-3-methylbut-2-enyl diphosphate reductase [Pseudomonadota bacterium]